MNDTQKLNKIVQLKFNPFIGRGLTDVEEMTVRWIAFGLTIKDTADELRVSEGTIKLRLKKACPKLGIDSSKELTKEWHKLLHAVLS